jgi:hypothetical protein
VNSEGAKAVALPNNEVAINTARSFMFLFELLVKIRRNVFYDVIFLNLTKVDDAWYDLNFFNMSCRWSPTPDELK